MKRIYCLGNSWMRCIDTSPASRYLGWVWPEVGKQTFKSAKSQILKFLGSFRNCQANVSSNVQQIPQTSSLPLLRLWLFTNDKLTVFLYLQGRCSLSHTSAEHKGRRLLEGHTVFYQLDFHRLSFVENLDFRPTGYELICECRTQFWYSHIAVLH
jgi:hypothetical protein